MTSVIPIKKLFKTALYTSVLIAALELAIAPVDIIKSGGLPPEILLHTIFIPIIWIVNILLVYLTEKYGRDNFPVYMRYVLSYLICIGLMILSELILRYVISDDTSALEQFLRHNSDMAPGREKMLAKFVPGFAIITIVLIIQDLILLREKKAMIEFENTKLKIKSVEATNEQLKQQIHPHFLFNSLNTLKTLINKNPDKAEDYLIKLSDFLRASISSDTPNLVKLFDEIKLCYDYLEMQKMRFGEALQYTVNIPDEIQNSGFVPVFSLLPLLENAIKHNILTTEFPLHIKVAYENGRIKTTNNLQPKLTSETSTGLGLENLAERYKILSGNDIIINKTDNIFTVSIKILENL